MPGGEISYLLEYHSLAARGVIPPFVVMLHGPRDETEFTRCVQAVEEAYLAAGGSRTDSDGRARGFQTD